MGFEKTKVELYPEVEKNDKIALIDADTIAFGACSVCEYSYYDIEAKEDKFDINIDDALSHALEKIDQILASTGCKDAELYFTSGLHFRYTVDPDYKSNRKDMHRPQGLYEVKTKLLEEYNGAICTEYEADDMVVYLKKKNPDKYILTAVDKDVLNCIPGKHFNYYSSIQYNIQPKFIETNKQDALMFNYLQAIIGDTNDGIKGVPGIGPAKAKKFINNSMTEQEMWLGVVKAFESKGLSILDAMTTVQLVSMHQLIDDNGPKLELFNPNKLFKGD